jgi:DNA-directed RNA polymerase subunit RPC12/RpoP
MEQARTVEREVFRACPNCGSRKLEERETEWVEQHGLDCGPYEHFYQQWLECLRCGERIEV